MNRPWKSISWEYGLCILLPSLALLSVFLIVPFLFRILIGAPNSAFEAKYFYVPHFVLNLLIVGTWVAYSFDSLPKRFYDRPLSHHELNLWLTCVPAAMAVFCYAVMAQLVEWLYDAEWPFLRPAIYTFAITILGLNIERLWQLRRYSISHLTSLWLLALLVTGYFSLHPAGHTEPFDPHTPLTVWELAMLTISAVGGIVAGHRHLRSLRCGDVTGPQQEMLTPRWREIADYLPRSNQESRSDFQFGANHSVRAVEAYLWHHSYFVPLIATPILGIASMGAQWLVTRGTSETPEICFVMTSVTVWIAALFQGITVGRCVRLPGKSNAQTMSSFVASKPISDSEFLKAVTRTLAKGCTISWIILCILSIAIPLIGWRILNPDQPFDGQWYRTVGWMIKGMNPPFTICVWVLLLFLLMACVSSITAAGSLACRDVLMSSVATAIMSAIVFIFVITEALPIRWHQTARAIATAGLGIAIASSTCWLFVYGLRTKAVTVRQCWLGLATWLVLVSGYGTYQQMLLRVHINDTQLATILQLMLVALFLSLASTGIAALPVGLRVGRHA